METTTTSSTTATVETKAGDKGSTAFNMRALSMNLPHKRKGLSNYYSGKSRSFACLADAASIEDLEKPTLLPEAKRRKYSERQSKAMTKETTLLSTSLSCRNESSTAPFSRSCVGV